jgi:hypothetical protein
LYISTPTANTMIEKEVFMNQVPKMISTKDLDYIKDMLSWNHIASKKAFHYLEHVQDEQVRNVLTEVTNMHTKHYKHILDLLK